MSHNATDVEALDAAIDRLIKIIPSQPYVQVIPQDEPKFHHYNRYHADAWLRDAPFQPTESPSLQYQTWFYREHGSDTIHLRTHASTDHQVSRTPVHTNSHHLQVPPSSKRNSVTDSLPPSSQPADSPSGNTSSAPKKKMSLAAYKKTASSSQNTPLPISAAAGPPAARPSPPPTSSRHTAATSLKADALERAKQPALVSTPSDHQKRKRSPHEPDEPLKRQKSPSPPATVSTPPPTKSKGLPDRLSPLKISSTSHGRVASGQSAAEHDLPPRLSPLKIPAGQPKDDSSRCSKRDDEDDQNLPQRLSPLASQATRNSNAAQTSKRKAANDNDDGAESPPPFQLPSPLSPTLPDVIVQGLKRRALKKAKLQTNHSPDDPDSAPAAVHSSTVSAGSTVQPKSSSSNSEQKSTLDHRSDDKSSGLQRKIVKLKIPKPMRIDFRRLLQFPPKPKLSRTMSNDSRMSNDESASRSDKTAKTNGLFGPIKDITSFQAKKAAATGVLATLVEEGRIPHESPSKEDNGKSGQLITPPPAVSDASHKHSHLTPSTGRKMVAAAMARSDSTDGAASAATPASPSITDLSQSVRPSPRIGSTSSAKTAELQAWWTEREKFMELAKLLKKRHAAKHMDRATSLRATSKSESKRESILAAMTNIESFATFMLSFHCHDTSYAHRNPPIPHPNPKNTWCTLHGFWRYINNISTPWPALHSLVARLGQVYNARILNAITHGGQTTSNSGSTSLVRGGPEEQEAVMILTKTLNSSATPAAPSRNLLRALRERNREGIGFQTSVSEAVSTAVLMLGDPERLLDLPSEVASFQSRLKGAMASSSLVASQ